MGVRRLPAGAYAGSAAAALFASRARGGRGGRRVLHAAARCGVSPPRRRAARTRGGPRSTRCRLSQSGRRDAASAARLAMPCDVATVLLQRAAARSFEVEWCRAPRRAAGCRVAARASGCAAIYGAGVGGRRRPVRPGVHPGVRPRRRWTRRCGRQRPRDGQDGGRPGRTPRASRTRRPSQRRPGAQPATSGHRTGLGRGRGRTCVRKATVPRGRNVCSCSPAVACASVHAGFPRGRCNRSCIEAQEGRTARTSAPAVRGSRRPRGIAGSPCGACPR